MTKFSGTSISCIGYGTDHNVDLLKNISSEGGGSYYVVDNLEDIAVVFGDILGGLVSCVSQQVRVILPTGTEVKTRYALNNINNNLEVVIGDLPAGMEAVFLAKIPTNTPVTLKGYNLQTHTQFEITKIVESTTDNILQINGKAHYLRFEVLSLLEQSQTLLLRRASKDEVTELITKINTCIDTISEYRQTHAHSLWDILLDELKTCKDSLENRHNQNHDTTQLMTQHGAYLGMMRGIAVNLSQNPTPIMPVTGTDNNGLLSPINLDRSFSNSVQRQIRSQLQTTMTPVVVRQRGVTSATTLDNNSSTPSTPLPSGISMRSVTGPR